MTAISLASIRLDGGTQPRASINLAVVEEYANNMADGAQFPPLTVFYDGTDHWLADGFYRHAASKAFGITEVDCDVRQGTRRDAVLFSVGANAAHGMRRSSEDKRRAVMMLLNDPEWSGWSDREIARRSAVSHPFVAQLRPKPSADTGNRCQYESRTFVHPKTGTPTTMNTARIGSNPPRQEPVATQPSMPLSRPSVDVVPAACATSTRKEAPPAWMTSDISAISAQEAAELLEVTFEQVELAGRILREAPAKVLAAVDNESMMVDEAAQHCPPPDQASTMIDRFAADRAVDHYWKALKAVGGALSGIPEPEEVALHFPQDLEHEISLDDAERWADWFARFADAWTANAPARAMRAAKLQAFLKETAHVGAD